MTEAEQPQSEARKRNPDGTFASIYPVYTTDLIGALSRRAAHKALDFVPYYKFTDNIYGYASGEDDRPSLQELSAIMNSRLGVAWAATAEVAGDAMRNGFIFVDKKSRKEVEKEEIFEYMKNTDLMNQLTHAVRDDRGFGLSFLIKYWTKDDREVMDQEPPNTPPRKYRAHNPLYMTPINLGSTNELDYNKDVWNFSGGLFNRYNIHRDRIHVLCLRPVAGHWRGKSVFEPIWTALSGYFQCLIYLVRGFRNWGDSVPVMFSGDQMPQAHEVDAVLDIMDKFEMNRKFALGRDDKLDFKTTGIGRGITEIFEQFKEEICAGLRIPLNQLFGRSVGGGLAGAGALVSKEDYLQMIGNVQMSITDDILQILTDAGFDMTGLDLEWELAIKKTDQQKLLEEGMQLQNEMLKLQVKQQKEQLKMLKMQREMQETRMKLGLTEPMQQPQLTEQQKKKAIPVEAEEDFIPAEASNAFRAFYNSIRIDNHIEFPYKFTNGRVEP